MTPAFVILALLVAVSATAAMSLRNLVHCALCLIGTFVGLAGLYLQLDAQFVGFAQILVYVGAVGILIVFAILLTRGSEPPVKKGPDHPEKIWGVGIGMFVFLTLATVAVTIPNRAAPGGDAGAPPTVKAIGTSLMTDYVLPLEVIGLLLTAAMIGAVIIAMNEKGSK